MEAEIKSANQDDDSENLRLTSYQLSAILTIKPWKDQKCHFNEISHLLTVYALMNIYLLLWVFLFVISYWITSAVEEQECLNHKAPQWQ